MSNPAALFLPADQRQRDSALDAERSVLVQAPAGSGKTDLLTRRFLRLLAEVDDPSHVVAITFTNAAAAEMRSRILGELEKASTAPAADGGDFSMAALARRLLERSESLGWHLLDLPAQLRIRTIDSFCRDLALQQPLLSTLGGGLGIYEQPVELYRRAARRTLERIDDADSAVAKAAESLLKWRDNGWQEMENLLVKMLGERDRWMHDFVLGREMDAADLEALRLRLERPFANAVRNHLGQLGALLASIPGACDEALELARFGCTQSGGQLHRELAELAEFPGGPFTGGDELETARDAFVAVAKLLLTSGGTFRKRVDITVGFPRECLAEKARLASLIESLTTVPGLDRALAAVRQLPPAHYTEEEWQIVCACFTLLRHAAGELQVVFAEAGAVDFTEVAQIAQRVLRDHDGRPTDAALAVADNIHHLLVDEFQDTSRRQHQLLSSLISAWPDHAGRTCFVVGDPMQSIYFFRDADAELFRRVEANGLEVAQDEPLQFDTVRLSANFRTSPQLVNRLNEIFVKVFAADDGSGVTFSSAQPARDDDFSPDPRFKLHLGFVPQSSPAKAADEEAAKIRDAAHAEQTAEIVALIKSHMNRMDQARAGGGKYRIAVLGRARSALAPVAAALRQAAIPFRAVDLESLATRPEVLDALALARALLNPIDRVAWLGVLRAPWCGLTLESLHRLTSADDPGLLSRAVPELLAERLGILDMEERKAAQRVLDALDSVPALRAAQPTASLGTLLEQVWVRLGGPACVGATGRANLDLLWSCLDRLPAGEQDLLGPALDAALKNLTAQPDPTVSADCGVQLMTIHKSKGLEFEVVIVPDLQAASANTGHRMLSWMERGLAEPDDCGEITEFLIAPLQTKGAERSRAKAWVDRVYRQRESQEMRRILYVASTRAREELHLFARPGYKVESTGNLSLANPANCMLATAWPGVEDEVRARFEQWKAARISPPIGDEVVEDIAASGESNLVVMPSPAKPTILRRLAPEYVPSAPSFPRLFAERSLASETPQASLYSRHQGGLPSRALGNAVHTLLEELARLRTTQGWEQARTALPRLEPRIAAQIRATGVDPSQAGLFAAQAIQYALSASRDPVGQWILSPHTEAESEVSWAGIVSGAVRTVRVDRVFRAGPQPLSEGYDCWWIVDYKTAHAANSDPAALPKLRAIFAPQIEAYARVLRNLQGATAIRAGLYYPRMLVLDWWEL